MAEGQQPAQPRKPPKPRGSRRSRARRLAMQAIYQWQLNPQSAPGLIAEYDAQSDMDGADRDLFAELVQGVTRDPVALDAQLEPHLDRPTVQVDPLEHALLLLGVEELLRHPVVPAPVVLNEYIELAKQYGAQKSHAYINAVLEPVARTLRPSEFRDLPRRERQ